MKKLGRPLKHPLTELAAKVMENEKRRTRESSRHYHREVNPVTKKFQPRLVGNEAWKALA